MNVVIIGAGGFGREVLDVFDTVAAQWAMTARDTPKFVGFVDDGNPDLGRLGEAPFLGGIEVLVDLDADFTIGVGSPAARRTIDERAVGYGRNAVTLIHASATIGRDVRVGDGSVVCAQAALTTNITIGRHVHVNLGSTIGHDCVIGDFVTIAPGVNISGNVTVGDGVEFGTGAAVLPGVTIGEGAFVGAQALVTKDVPAGVTVVGVPAKPR